MRLGNQGNHSRLPLRHALIGRGNPLWLPSIPLCQEAARMNSDYEQELGEQLRQMLANLQYNELLTIIDNLPLTKSL